MDDEALTDRGRWPLLQAVGFLVLMALSFPLAFLGLWSVYSSQPERAVGVVLPCMLLVVTVVTTFGLASLKRTRGGIVREVLRVALIGLPGGAIAGLLSTELIAFAPGGWNSFGSPFLSVHGVAAGGMRVALAVLALTVLGQVLNSRAQPGDTKVLTEDPLRDAPPEPARAVPSGAAVVRQTSPTMR